MKALTVKSHTQQGAVLVIGLILLTVLVMIGITTTNLSASTEKMTSNHRNKELSLQAAESALSDGERWLLFETSIPEAIESCTVAPCELHARDTFNLLQDKNQSWWSSNARQFSGTIYQVNSQPLYIIEEYNFVPYELSPEARAKGEGYYYYKVTSRGVGSDNQATSIIQSIYTVQYK